MNMEGFILKKSTSLLFSGLLVSGMVLGTLPMTNTVQAADKVTTQAAASVTNNVVYEYNGKDVGKDTLQGVEGQPIKDYPKNYTKTDSGEAIFGKDGADITVQVTPIVTVKVNYFDQNGTKVNDEEVEGGAGNKYTLTDVPAGTSFLNDADKDIILEADKTYNIKVNAQVFNTVIFKTANNVEVGRAQVFSQNVGDTVQLPDSDIPSGYMADTKSVTLQSNNNTQIVTVNEVEPQAAGVVRVNDKTAQVYTSYGNVVSGRTLEPNSPWKYFETKEISGETYYRVGLNEWVKASDVTAKATTNEVTPFTDNVTTKDYVAVLYTKDGQAITGRGLNKNSTWKTANKLVRGGETYYQVATNEWVKASDVTVDAPSTNDDAVTPYKGVVTTNDSVAMLYSKEGKELTGRALGPHTDWQTANKMNLNGETYYQVATTEWVKASSLV